MENRIRGNENYKTGKTELYVLKVLSKVHILIFIIAIALFGCESKPKENQKTEVINFVEDVRNVNSFKLSDFADRVEYIPLDLTNRILIAKIQGLCISDSLMLIRDKGATYLFNASGKFIKSLYSLGRGPGEAYGTHIAVDNSDGSIYVGNKWSKKMMRFSGKGEFLDERNYKHFLWQFYLLKDRIVFAADPFHPDDGSFFVQFMNTDSVCYRHPFRYSHLPASRGGYSNMYVWFDVSDEKILFKEQVGDTIFSTSDFKNIEAAYILDFGSKGLKPDDYFSNNPNKFDDKQFITAFKESNNFLFMKGVDNDKLCQYMFDKKMKLLSKSFDLKIQNDLDGGPFLHFWEIENSTYDSNVLYFFIQPFELLDEANKLVKNSKLDKIIQSININSNPILVKVYLKQ